MQGYGDPPADIVNDMTSGLPDAMAMGGPAGRGLGGGLGLGTGDGGEGDEFGNLQLPPDMAKECRVM